MRKLLVFALSLFFIALSTPAQAADVIRLVSTPHRLFDGVFRNDELYNDILPTGKLGKLVFQPASAYRTWVIDPELISEIDDMSDGYTIVKGSAPQGEEAATRFMTQLRVMVSRDRVIALPYGNPDTTLATRLAPSELKFYYSYGESLLSALLGKDVYAEQGWSSGRSFASAPQRADYTHFRQAISRLSLVVDPLELATLRADLAYLLSPKLNKYDRGFFYYHASVAIKKTQDKLRISSGKYQLTSRKSKMPITLVNDFNSPITVQVQLIPLSYRLSVEDVGQVTVEAKSRLQLSVPFTVIAPGPSTVEVRLTNDKGTLLTEPTELAINATIIDSRVTWFTTAAGILLLLAGITQSVRRVRKARHEIA